jgi:hypothetical protein
MAKTKNKYRDDDAKKHQEVVTPPELVKRIYSFLDSEKDFYGKDILDPCVGPGALVEPLLENAHDWKWKSLTVMDIQELHIKGFKEGLQKYKKNT